MILRFFLLNKPIFYRYHYIKLWFASEVDVEFFDVFLGLKFLLGLNKINKNQSILGFSPNFWFRA
jgi:hypothetical protein